MPIKDYGKKEVDEWSMRSGSELYDDNDDDGGTFYSRMMS